jgi:hypothetical protein
VSTCDQDCKKDCPKRGTNCTRGSTAGEIAEEVVIAVSNQLPLLHTRATPPAPLDVDLTPDGSILDAIGDFLSGS